MLINSEIGKLNKVILHRPGLALKRLTPSNCHDLLFDDVLWAERAIKEHLQFENILKKNGVEVLLLHKLLKQALKNSEAKAWLLTHTIKRLYHNSELSEKLFNHLFQLPLDQLVSHLTGGLTWEESGIAHTGLVGRLKQKHDFLIAPLPNHYFTRDTSCWIGNRVSINPMFWKARRGETLNLAATYKFHPMFKKENFSIWYDGSELHAENHTIEGGDVLVINKDCVLIGISERTTPEAIEAIAHKLFATEDKQQIIAVQLPKARASMHLDTVMTMVDYGTFCTAFIDETPKAWCLRPGTQGKLKVTAEKDLFATIATALKMKKLKLISLSDHSFTKEREQWTDGSNLLAIKPGVVVGYECNTETNKLLRKEGIKVLSFSGSELGRGRGGARCMSCPIEREAI